MTLSPRQVVSTGLFALALALCALLTPAGVAPAHAASVCSSEKAIWGAREAGGTFKRGSQLIALPAPYFADGTAPVMWENNGRLNQRWCMLTIIRPGGGFGVYKFRNVTSGQCLDAKDGADYRTAVVQLSCSADSSQAWEAVPLRNGSFALRNMSGGGQFCLDIINKNTVHGAHLQTWTCSGAWNQAWVVEGFNPNP